MSKKTHEIRYDDKGMLDEFIVSNPKNFTMERMSRTDWHIVIDAADSRQHHIRFSSLRFPQIETE